MEQPQANGGMEDNLDEKAVPDVSFEGVKLSIESTNLLDENNPGSQTQSGDQPPVDNAEFQDGKKDFGFYFASQSGRLEAAAAEVQKTILTEEDGKVLGVWLLTQIDHWDNEKERVAIIAENSVLLVKYDFITNQIKSYQRIAYVLLDSIQKGTFVYPEKTLVTPRTGSGARLHWSKGRQLSVFEKWNPFSDTIPYMTLASHPLQTDNTRHPQSYQIGPFLNTLSQAVTASRGPDLPPVSMVDAPIQCEVYVGLSSMVFNQSKLGFFRERGGVSF